MKKDCQKVEKNCVGGVSGGILTKDVYWYVPFTPGNKNQTKPGETL